MMASFSTRRVVITGIGIISASGDTTEEFWRNVAGGVSAAAPIKRFSTAGLPCKIGAEVEDFNVKNYTDFPRSGRYDLSVQYSLAAATTALKDAGLASDNFDPFRAGVIEGSTINGMESTLKANMSLNESYKKIHPYNVVGGYFGEGSSAISIALGLRGQSMSYCSGCSSGADSIGYAKHLIADDDADVMLAGGSEAITKLLYSGFCKLGSMTVQNSPPSESMRPFDSTRDGFLLGEGSSFFVLEELSHALARGARVYAEIVSHSGVAEAYHSTDPHPEGAGYQKAISKTLKKAAIPPDAIQYINAHGSGTRMNDPVESFAITSIFGKHAKKLQVSASKPIFGHLMGGSGAIESAVTVLSIYNSEIPPTINLNNLDPNCRLDFVAKVSRKFPLENALCLNAGFGGRYSCIYYKRYQ